MKPLLLAFILSQGADIASTCYALGTGKFVEGNTILPTSCRNIGLVKASVTGLVSYAVLKNPDSKIAKFGLVIGASTTSVVVGINLNRIFKMK